MQVTYVFRGTPAVRLLLLLSRIASSLFNRRVGTVATATLPGVNDQHPQYPTYICTGTA